MVIAARRKDALTSLAADIARSHPRATVHVQTADVTDRAQVETLFKSTVDALGAVDIVISCSGVMYFTMMENLKLAEWDQTVAVNCNGLLNILAAALPRLLSRDASHFVAISSDAGRSAYALS